MNSTNGGLACNVIVDFQAAPINPGDRARYRKFWLQFRYGKRLFWQGRRAAVQPYRAGPKTVKAGPDTFPKILLKGVPRQHQWCLEHPG